MSLLHRIIISLLEVSAQMSERANKRNGNWAITTSLKVLSHLVLGL